MRKGAKVCVPREVVEKKIGTHGDARLRGVSYDAATDTFCFVLECAQGQNGPCKLFNKNIEMQEPDAETGNWPVVQFG